MKIILFGASGFIGSSLLTHCLQQPTLTSLIVFSRRQLPSITSLDPRIKVIVLENFFIYPESVINELTGSKACFWAVGGLNYRIKIPGQSDSVEIIQYPLAAAKALIAASSSTSNSVNTKEKTRFFFLSGALAERNQTKSLWFIEEGRKAQGRVETKLLDLADEYSDFETVIIHSGGVLRKENWIPELAVGLSRVAIRIDELAAFMVDSAVNGVGSGTVGNEELRKKGKALLEKRGE
ncbi:hypothetical protein N431DRAFT_385569 [Stipitochalara longipes BDJ]|nr:hypothetical protein N431DRAFT_385569 [Stipitochalara longipes BDJ]